MNMAVEVHAPSQPVLVVGVLVALLAILLLHTWGQHANRMADRITIDTKGLPREQQRAILDRCNTGCDAVVQGRVIGRMGNTWLSADFFRFLHTPVTR